MIDTHHEATSWWNTNTTDVNEASSEQLDRSEGWFKTITLKDTKQGKARAANCLKGALPNNTNATTIYQHLRPTNSRDFSPHQYWCTGGMVGCEQEESSTRATSLLPQSTASSKPRQIFHKPWLIQSLINQFARFNPKGANRGGRLSWGFIDDRTQDSRWLAGWWWWSFQCWHPALVYISCCGKVIQNSSDKL